MWVYVLEIAIIRGAMAPLAPPVPAPLLIESLKSGSYLRKLFLQSQVFCIKGQFVCFQLQEKSTLHVYSGIHFYQNFIKCSLYLFIQAYSFIRNGRVFHFFFNSTTDTFSLIKIAPGAYTLLYSHDPPVSTPPSLTSCLEVIFTSFLHN